MKITVHTVAKPDFNLEHLTISLPTPLLERLANPTLNWVKGKMVERRGQGDALVELRCYMGHLLPDEASNIPGRGFLDENEFPETVAFIKHLYRTFGPMPYMRVAHTFDSQARIHGASKLGAMIVGWASEELDRRGRVIAEPSAGHVSHSFRPTSHSEAFHRETLRIMERICD